MSVQTRHVRVAVQIAVLLALTACSHETRQLTGPPLSTPRLTSGGIEGTPANVCVSAGSPVGNYTFTVSNIDFAAGGFTVTANSAIIGPGACFTLASRTFPQDPGNPAADPYTTITYSYTSSDVPGGAAHVSTNCVDDPGAPASSPCGETVVAHVNIVHGTVATFSFVSSVQKIEDLRDEISNLDISKAAKHELDDRLRDASKEAGKGHNKSACKQLDQFIKKLSELSKQKKIDGTDAANLSSAAEEIQTILGC